MRSVVTIRILVLVILVTASLGACADSPLPSPGFATRYFMGLSAPSDSDACAYATDSACSPVPGFCVARGYRPQTVGYERCVVSVLETLAKERR